MKFHLGAKHDVSLTLFVLYLILCGFLASSEMYLLQVQRSMPKLHLVLELTGGLHSRLDVAAHEGARFAHKRRVPSLLGVPKLKHNKKLPVTSASLLVTSALLVVTRS